MRACLLSARYTKTMKNYWFSIHFMQRGRFSGITLALLRGMSLGCIGGCISRMIVFTIREFRFVSGVKA